MPANKPEDYEVLGTIGTGSYGTCKKIRRKTDGKVYQINVCNLKSGWKSI